MVDDIDNPVKLIRVKGTHFDSMKTVVTLPGEKKQPSNYPVNLYCSKSISNSFRFCFCHVNRPCLVVVQSSPVVVWLEVTQA